MTEKSHMRSKHFIDVDNTYTVLHIVHNTPEITRDQVLLS